VDALGRSYVEDPYALEQVIQKAADLVSGKTIARALQHSAMPSVSAGKVDPDSRAPVLFTKQEATRKVELSLDLESLQMDMNVLKTMYKKQEKGREKHEKHIQSLIESVRASVSRSGYQREFPPPQNQNRYSGPSGPAAPRTSRKCYYCFRTDHLFLNCIVVTNFIRPYLHQFSIDSHSLNCYGKPLKRPFDWYQSCLEMINNGRDIRQINW